MPHGTDSTRARVILLGASNLTKCMPLVIETARNLLGSPLDVYAAIGHGRSYGWTSFLLVRSLPSVLDSGLWRRLDDQSPKPTYGLITDIGNDVMYGATPDEIVGWVEQCIDRLEALGARIVMTALPMETIEQLREWHYLAARTIFFPTKRLTFQQARQRARRLSERLTILAESRNIPIVRQCREWYGADPIHPKRRARPGIWAEVLQHWRGGADSDPEPIRPASGSLALTLQLRLTSPEQWWLLGLRRGRAQPSVRLRDGTTVGYY